MTTLQLLKNLINRPSVSPDDQACQLLIAEYLQNLGFDIQHLPFGRVANLWARYGHQKPLFVFAGHTDVVPPGNEAEWFFPPFQATEQDGKLYGRGTADMKGAIAAMMSAVQRRLTHIKKINGSIAFLITSDEEAEAIDGTKKVVEWLKNQNIQIDYCLVGEATCVEHMGDTIKVGRRGSLSGKLKIFGKQGHIAYPHLAENPIHKAFSASLELTQFQWDKIVTPHFSETSLQISNIHAGVGANNVIPGEMTIDFNLRYSPAISSAQIKTIIEEILQKHQLKYEISFQHSGNPFYSEPSHLAETLVTSINQLLQQQACFSTSGGTSDGRFLHEISKEIIEFGVRNESIHKVNEHIFLSDLEALEAIYYDLLLKLV